MLGKPLSMIDYGTVNTNDNILDNSFLLPSPLPIKLSVQVPVSKFFALDIDFVAITGRSSQKKLSFIRKIFSSVNGFGGASTFLKFDGIICGTFTLKKAMMAVEKLANDHGVVVNTNLKRPVNNHTNWAIMLKEIPVRTFIKAMHTAVSVFEQIKMIKIQLVGLWQKAIIKLKDQNIRNKFRTLLYTLSMGTMIHNLWDFIGSVDRKTCLIKCNSAVANTPVIKGISLCWSYLITSLCSVCNFLGHLSLVCKSAGVSSIPKSKRASLSAQDKFRLAKIYEKKSALVSRPLVFGGKTWADVVGKSPFCMPSGSPFLLGSVDSGKPIPSVGSILEICLVSIESSFVDFMGQISELTKRLDSLVLVVSQPSPKCQLPEDTVMGVDSDKATSDKTATIVDFSAFPHVVKLEKMLEELSKSVLSLSVYFDGLVLASSVSSQTPSQ
ncbi:hypothetical protein G9A89_012272 [Geosiphon pyriformis]|nr:hypothetical protein G9A89_012272 [Geosiphon pyriformis]